MIPPIKKEIDVIIATHKRPESLKRTLSSILECRVNDQFDYCLTVVDNNSLDQTKNVVTGLMPLFKGKLKYLFESKQGKNNALNTAIQQTSGEYIVLTDDDCLMDKEWLVNIVSVLKEKDVDILGGPIKPFFERPIPSWIDLNNKIFHGPLVHYQLSDRYFDSTEQMIFPPGANMVIRRSAYIKFNGFEQGTRAQDTEICYNWHRLGAKIGYAPNVLVHHITPDSRLNKNYFRHWQFLSGKNSSTISTDEYKKEGRIFWGVPLWMYKSLFKSIGRYLTEIFNVKKNFVNELWIHLHWGEIQGIRSR